MQVFPLSCTGGWLQRMIETDIRMQVGTTLGPQVCVAKSRSVHALCTASDQSSHHQRWSRCDSPRYCYEGAFFAECMRFYLMFQMSGLVSAHPECTKPIIRRLLSLRAWLRSVPSHIFCSSKPLSLESRLLEPFTKMSTI